MTPTVVADPPVSPNFNENFFFDGNRLYSASTTQFCYSDDFGRTWSQAFNFPATLNSFFAVGGVLYGWQADFSILRFSLDYGSSWRIHPLTGEAPTVMSGRMAIVARVGRVVNVTIIDGEEVIDNVDRVTTLSSGISDGVYVNISGVKDSPFLYLPLATTSNYISRISPLFNKEVEFPLPNFRPEKVGDPLFFIKAE